MTMSGHYLIFKLGDLKCAFERSEVQEVLPYVALNTPPGLPQVLAGFVNLGGQFLPVLHLLRILGLTGNAERLDSHLIHLRQSHRLCLVERVLTLAVLPEPRALDAEHVFNDWAAGILEHQGQAIYLLRPEQLLLREENLRLNDLQAQINQRLMALDSHS